MIKYLYAIHDKLAEIYSAPFALNPKTVQRTFDFMAKERNEQDCKDQHIVYLGTYEDETGTITPAEVIIEAYDLEKEWKRKHED